MGRKLNLDAPLSFNEKIQWLKLYDRNPLYTQLVDKIAVKDWVAKRIGKEHIVPTIAVWDNVNDVDLNVLPDKFVLKTNHDSGGVVVCEDFNEFDLDAVKGRLLISLRRNYYFASREWPYKNVKPKVFAEEYIEPSENGDVVDYKLLCFDGEPRYFFTCTGRASGDLRVDFFDLEWNHLPFSRHYPNADVPPGAPKTLSMMLSAARVLSKGFPFVRIDFYEVDGRMLFGELTLYPGAGLEEFTPAEWDVKLGQHIDLRKAYSLVC